MPENPISDSDEYKFGGWKYNERIYNKDTDDIYEWGKDVTFEARYVSKSTKETSIKVLAGIGNFANGDKVKYISLAEGADTGKIEEPTAIGYKFDNFYINGAPITAEWSIVSDEQVTVEAKYIPTNYYIVYEGGGADKGSMEMEIATYGVAHKLAKVKYERDGAYFAGWAKDSDIPEYGDEQEVLNLCDDTSESNVVTLTACWLLKRVKVNYEPNGTNVTRNTLLSGSADEDDGGLFGAQRAYQMSSNEFPYGLGTLQQNKYYRPGYVFVGWALSPDSSVVYSDLSQLSDIDTYEEEITLYAKWKPVKEMYGSLKLASCFGDMNSILNSGAKINGAGYVDLLLSRGEVIPKPTLENRGYVFDYWTEGRLFQKGNIIVAIGDTYKVAELPEVCDFNKEIVLIAHWKPITYKVRFYDNFGDNKYTEVTATYGERVPLPSSTVEKRGNAKLLGWNTNKDAKEPRSGYTVNDKTINSIGLKPISDPRQDEVVNVYAVWDRDEYKIKLHGVDPKNPEAVKTETFKYGQERHILGIATNSTIINGVEKVFSGWSTDEKAKDMTYYDAAVADRIYDHENFITQKELLPGLGLYYDITPEIDLYPVWVDKANTSLIIFDANGGTVKGNNKWAVTFNAGQEIKYPSKDDLYNKGFELAAEGDWVDASGKVYNNTVATAGSELHLYANWKQSTYTIEYIGAGDGTIVTGGQGLFGASVQKEVLGGQDTTISYNDMFERPGYEFIGWDVSVDANTVIYKAGEVVKALGDANQVVKLYTVWQPKVYEVQYYDGNGVLIGTNSFLYTKNVRLLANEGMSDSTQDAGYTYEVNGEVKKFSSGQSISAIDLEIGITEKEKLLNKAAKKKEQYSNDQDTGLFGNVKNLFNGLFGADPVDDDKDLGAGPEVIKLTGATAKQVYNITFNANGGHFTDGYDSMQDGNEVKIATASTGDSMVGKMPADPEKGTNQFVGWAASIDGTLVEFNDTTYPFTESIELIARYNTGYKARLLANGGEFADGSSEQTVTMVKNESTSKFEIPTRYLHDFAGYYVNGTRGEEKLGDTWTYFANDVTDVNAHWIPYNYRVVYDANSGDGYMGYDIATIGVAHPLKENAFTKDGYKFDGWYVEALSTILLPGETIYDLTNVKNGTVVIKANWKPLTYDVVYHANEGKGVMTPDTGLTYGKSHKLKANAFTRDGYKFRGWSLATGSDIAYFDKATLSNIAGYKAVINLYAEWLDSKEIYGVLKLHGNKGLINGVSDVEISLRYHEALTEPALERTGYKFKKNWTDANGNVVAFPTICDFKELELTANWEPIKYNVRYYANGGTFTNGSKDFVDEKDIAYDTTFNLKAATEITKARYTFGGWKYTDENGDKVFTAGDPKTNLSKVDGDTVNLYAIWTGDKYTITLHQVDPAGNALAADTVMTDIVYGSNTKLEYIASKIATVSNIGYEFAGWAVPTNRANVKYFAAQDTDKIYAVEGNKNIELYPVWVRRDYIVYVTFDGNGGTVNGANRWVVPFASNSELVYPLTENVVNKGYTLNGWLDSDKTTTLPAHYIITESKTIYADWTPGSYTIEYIAVGDGVENTMAPESKSTAGKTTLDPNVYERLGYRFVGWDTNPDAKVAIYGDAEPNLEPLADIGETIRLYTVWAANEYTITYKDVNGNVIGTNTLTYGKTVTLLSNTNIPIGQKDTGFVLQGHSDVKFTSGQTVTGQELKITKTTNLSTGIVLNGTTEKIVYIITFDANGGKYPNGKKVATASICYGDPVASKLPGNPVYAGKTFTGYTVDGAYRDVNTINYEYLSSKTFLADWDGTVYKIAFNDNAPVSPDTTKVNIVTGVKMATQSALAFRDTQINPNSRNIVGYNFVGWATASYTAKEAEQMRDAHDPRIIGNHSIVNWDRKNGETVILYAMWARNKYRLTLAQNEDKNHSNVADPYITDDYIYYDELLSENNAFSAKTRTNYTFANKFTKTKIAEPYDRKNYSGTDFYTLTSVYRETNDITLYPLWINDEKVITLNIDPSEAELPKGFTSNTFVAYYDAPLGSKGAVGEPKYENGVLVTPVATPYEVFLFDYWSTVKGDASTKVTSDMIYDGSFDTIYENVRLREEYMLTYDANGGNGYMAPRVMKEGIKVNTDKNTFTKKGYFFNGWVDQDGTPHGNGYSILNPSRPVNLTAKWEKEPKGSNGGTGGGGGGGSIAIPGNLKTDLGDGFSLQTTIPYTDYQFIKDGNAPTGVLLKKSSTLAKALLNSKDYTSRYKVIDGNNDYIMLKNGFYNIQRLDGSYYYLLDIDGNIKTGFVTVGTLMLHRVNAQANKIEKAGESEGGKYYLYEEMNHDRGILYSQPITVNGVKYLFDSAGRVISANGIENNTTQLASTNSNKVVKGWKYDPINNKWSYNDIDSTGRAYSYTNGAFPIVAEDGKTYYYVFDKDGIMMTGLIRYNGNVYYLREKGALTGAVYTGTILLGNKKYIFDETGAMVTPVSALTHTEEEVITGENRFIQ